MAKIKEFRCEIKGRVYTININCTSLGLFTANLPDEVHQSLGLQPKLETTTLNLLEQDLTAAIEKYKKAQTSQELVIFIKYGAGGDFTKDSKGGWFLQGYRNPLIIRTGGFESVNNILGFDYMVMIKETVDENVKWYKTRFGKKNVMGRGDDPDAYHKDGGISSHKAEKYNKIPFSEEALSKLGEISERIRSASEILFNFVSQDEDMIEHMLLNNQLSLK